MNTFATLTKIINKWKRQESIPSEFHNVAGVLFEDSAVPILVRFCQVATGHGVPESEELSLAAMGLHCYNQIAQTLASRQLTKYKDFELIPAREVLYVLVTLILSNNAIKLAAIKMLC